MTMFPGPGAQIYRNDAGEVLGWDYPSEPDPNDFYDDDARSSYADGFAEDCWERGYEAGLLAHELVDADHDPRNVPAPGPVPDDITRYGARSFADTYRDGYADGFGTACLNDTTCRAERGDDDGDLA